MRHARYAFVLMALITIGAWGESAETLSRQIHQAPDQDGVYYAGPEVSAPRMVSTVLAPYPSGVYARDVQGMTVLAMVIGANSKPSNVQILHTHGASFDESPTAAVMHSTFEPGKLGGKPVPVWIDVRVVFHANRSDAI